MKKRSKFTLVEVVVAGALLSALLLPALQRARERARQSNCRSNLKQIGTAFAMFASCNGDELPDTVDRLRAAGHLRDYYVYVCPSTDVQAGSGEDRLSWSNGGTGSGRANLSYAYHAGLKIGNSAETGRGDSGVSADLTGDAGVDSNGGRPNHSSYGNILYLDCHVMGCGGAGWFSPANAGYPDLPVGSKAAMAPNTLRDPVTGQAR